MGIDTYVIVSREALLELGRVAGKKREEIVDGAHSQDQDQDLDPSYFRRTSSNELKEVGLDHNGSHGLFLRSTCELRNLCDGIHGTIL